MAITDNAVPTRISSFVCAWFCVAAGSGEVGYGATWESVTRQWEAAAQNNRTVRLRIEERSYNGQPLVLSASGRLARSTDTRSPAAPIEYRREVQYVADSVRWRIESNGEAWDSILSKIVRKHSVDGWDGTIRAAFDDVDGPPSQHRRPGWLSNRPTACQFRKMPQHIPLVLLTQPCAPGCSLFDPAEWEPEGNLTAVEEKDGVLLRQSLRSKVHSDLVAHVFVDESKSFVPRRYIRGGIRVMIEYLHDLEFGWIPSEWRATSISSDKASVEFEVVAKVLEIELGKESDDSDYRVEFPPGAVVRDATANHGEIRTFFIRQDGSRREITKGEWLAGLDYARLDRTRPGELAATLDVKRSIVSRTVSWVLLANVSALAIILAVWIRCRRRSTSG